VKWHNALVVGLEIQINRDTDVPIHEQVAAQVVLHIGSGMLRPGDALPSVRSLARRLGIHRNTVTQAYRDPVLTKLVVKSRGSQLVVRDPQGSKAEAGNELDEFVDSAIRAAGQHGYTLQQLAERLRDRLLAAPPDHILLVSNDAGMRVLMPAEISERFSMPIRACSTGDLLAHRDLLLGALLVTAPGNIPALAAMIPAGRPAIPVTYSSAWEHLSKIRRLAHPSLIVLASISEYFLEMAAGVLAPTAAQGHSLRSLLISPGQPVSLGAADLIFCDSCAYPVVRGAEPRAEVVRHQLISTACLDQIQTVLDGGRWVQGTPG
jgi:GntR family transcriptional regulator